jgi:large subunit ribosomal protein L25
MISLDATVRDNTTKGQLSAIRDGGNVPAIIYGGKGENEKISISKKILKATIEKENFLSNIISISVNGKNQNVLPREVVYDVLTDEPIHVDFLRVVPGVKIRIEVPVEFINHEKSPGLKRGGVLNIVRRKVELKCPAENIPDEIVVDLAGTDIGTSIKISSVKLEGNVVPTITDRDFVIATVASPTVIKEPEKPAEGEAAAEGAEGETPVEGADAAATGKDGEAAKKDDKSKEGADKKPDEKKPAEKK